MKLAGPKSSEHFQFGFESRRSISATEERARWRLIKILRVFSVAKGQSRRSIITRSLVEGAAPAAGGALRRIDEGSHEGAKQQTRPNSSSAKFKLV